MMRITNVALPDGRNDTQLGAALVALDDEDLWVDDAPEMYLTVREGLSLSMLTVIRRGVRVCLICKEAQDEPPGFVSNGEVFDNHWHAVESDDVTVFYPDRYFIGIDEAREAIAGFARTLSRSDSLSWERLDPQKLRYEYYDG